MLHRTSTNRDEAHVRKLRARPSRRSRRYPHPAEPGLRAPKRHRRGRTTETGQRGDARGRRYRRSRRQKYHSPFLARESAESPCSARRRCPSVRGYECATTMATDARRPYNATSWINKRLQWLHWAPVTFFIFLKEHRAEPIIPPNKNPGWPPSRMAHPRSTCGKIARLVALERDCRRPLVHTKPAAERMRVSEAMAHFPRATLGVPGA